MIVETLSLMLMSMGSVGLWTLRVTMAARDRRAVASGVAAIEAVVFALSFSQLLTDLDQIHRLAGYSTGVAIGTYAGMSVSQHLRPARQSEPGPDEIVHRGTTSPSSGGTARSESSIAGPNSTNGLGARVEARCRQPVPPGLRPDRSA